MDTITKEELIGLMARNPRSLDPEAWVERINGELGLVPEYAVWDDDVEVVTIGRLGALVAELLTDEERVEWGFSSYTPDRVVQGRRRA